MSKENRAVLKEKVSQQLTAFVEMVTKDDGKLDRLLRSGAIDLSEPESGYATAHKIMCALGREMESQHNHQLSSADKKDVSNYYSFL